MVKTILIPFVALVVLAFVLKAVDKTMTANELGCLLFGDFWGAFWAWRMASRRKKRE